MLAVSTGALVYASIKSREASLETTDNCTSGTVITKAEAENDSSLVICYCSGLSSQVVLLESMCLPWIEMKATALALQNAAAGACRCFAVHHPDPA